MESKFKDVDFRKKYHKDYYKKNKENGKYKNVKCELCDTKNMTKKDLERHKLTRKHLHNFYMNVD